MPYTLLYVRIFRGNGASLSENFQFLNGLNDSKVPIHRILRGFFGYLPVSCLKVIFSRCLNLNAVFLQRVIPCLDSNSSENSASGRLCSDNALRMFNILSAYFAKAANNLNPEQVL